jgi:ATP-dependent Lon protease
MFYDMQKRSEGLVRGYDFIVWDEIQKMQFTDMNEMPNLLKSYMESGEFTVGDYKGVSDAGIIFCGNISDENMNEDSVMFSDLHEIFRESALMDRIHGLIKGWDIPRMTEDLKVSGWALNSEYFCSILHALRDDGSYRSCVEQLIETPKAADTRDTEAIKRIATAYLKLFFPHVSEPSDISTEEFSRYCLEPACHMRRIIKEQMGRLDPEYRGKDIPNLTIRSTK